MLFLCPVPDHKCTGTTVSVESAYGRPKGSGKVHGSQKDVKRCVRRWLVSEGYTPGRNREFHKPGEPVIVVSKMSGMPLRKGKSGEKSAGQGRRFRCRKRPGISAL